VGVGGIRIELPPADDGPTQALDCAVPAPPQSLTRWSLIDIDGALDATFGPGTTLASQLGYAESPFERDLSSDFAYQLYQVAQARVAAAVPRHDLVVCDADDDAGEDCVQSFLRDYGKKLYRRPLTRDQVSAYVAQFQSASRDTTPAGAAKTALVSMVLSPYFVFRVELSQGADPRLTPYEVATRLARFATRRPPDAVLLAAAEDNALQNAPQLDAQLQRLWATDAGRDARALLHLEWFRLQGPNWRKDLDPDLHADMDAQARAFIADGHQAILKGFVEQWYADGCPKVWFEVDRDINGKRDPQGMIVELPREKSRRAKCFATLKAFYDKAQIQYDPEDVQDDGEPYMDVMIH